MRTATAFSVSLQPRCNAWPDSTDATPVAEAFRKAVSRLLGVLETATGQAFLERFVTGVAELFDADSAVAARIHPTDPACLQTLAVYNEGRIVDNSVWPLAGSPAAEVFDSAAPCIFRSRVQERFPDDRMLARTNAYCCTGVPLLAGNGEKLGLVALLDRREIRNDLLAADLLQLFADRVSAEIEQRTVGSHRQQHQQRLEAHLECCRNDLKETRHELETLSHAVSHDLRGPLRAINGFSEILIAEYGGKLDSGATDYLRRIRSNARQMDKLLHALLLLSRVTRHPLQLSQVNLSRICTRSLARLQQRDPQRRVELSIRDNLHACGDPQLMTIALDQLLDNAWRYTSGSDPARIAFSGEQQDDIAVFCLTDNGIGFDMAYADRLFELFQRLHGQQEDIGAGAGLTTVKRIIERHGGTIRAQAAPGVGASFYFALPVLSGDDCSE